MTESKSLRMTSDSQIPNKAVLFTDEQVKWLRQKVRGACVHHDRRDILAALDCAFPMTVEFNPDYSTSSATERADDGDEG